MYLVTITPIERGVFTDDLTYFSKAATAVGSLVMAPIRGRHIVGLVTSIVPAHTAKASLKSSDFSLKKIESIIHPGLFEPAFIEAAKITAQMYALPLGQVLKSATPKLILDTLAESKWPQKISTDNGEKSQPATLPEAYALQDTEIERISFYRSLIREAFARHQSVLVIVPTAYDAEKIYPQLSKGIEPYTVVLHSKIGETEIKAAWKNALTSDHPELIIATPLYMALPKAQIGTVVVEHSADDDYFPITRPFFDPRFLAEAYARVGHKSFILADTALSVETILRLEEKKLLPASPIKFRLFAETKTKIADMRTKKDGPPDEMKEFMVIGQDLTRDLQRAQERKTRTFLLVGRRGLSSITVCSDCNTTINCDVCHGPLVLHTRGKSRLYICHKCLEEKVVHDICPICHGFRLRTLGIGTETTAAAVLELFPEAPVFIVDTDHTNTSTKAVRVVAEFMATPGGVLIGTEMALRYLTDPISIVGIVSLDHLLALPDFRSRERLLHLLIKAKELTQDTLTIQTRLPDELVFDQIASGQILDFYRTEFKEREAALYPPYSVLVKITRSGHEETVTKDLDKLSRLLSQYKPAVFPAFNTVIKGKYTAHLLIKVRSDVWPAQELVEVLQALPPIFTVNVGPADIL